MTAKELCLHFNDKKSHCIVIGPRYHYKLAAMHLLGKPVEWVNTVKYLGVTLVSSKKIVLDFNQVRRKFFGCVNSILSHSHGMSEIVKLHLMESYCYPVLSYALECFHLSSTHMQQLNACWNSVYRKIFHYKPWTSVRELIHCLERMNFEYLFYQKKLCFLHNLMFCNNSMLPVLWKFLHTLMNMQHRITLQMLHRLTIKLRLDIVYK